MRAKLALTPAPQALDILVSVREAVASVAVEIASRPLVIRDRPFRCVGFNARFRHYHVLGTPRLRPRLDGSAISAYGCEARVVIDTPIAGRNFMPRAW